LFTVRGEAPVPLVAVDVAVDAPDLFAEHVHERERRALDDRHIGSALARGGGHLCSDPSRADDRHARAPLERCAQLLAVGQGAQVVDAAEVGSR
jgi:hypothetical protein